MDKIHHYKEIEYGNLKIKKMALFLKIFDNLLLAFLYQYHHPME